MRAITVLNPGSAPVHSFIFRNVCTKFQNIPTKLAGEVGETGGREEDLATVYRHIGKSLGRSQ